MKTFKKILIGLAPVATIATAMPIALTSCSNKEPEIESLVESRSKLNSYYYTDEMYFRIAEQYAFDYDTLASKRTIHFTYENLRKNDKVTGEPKLTYSPKGWAYDSTTRKSTMFSCTFGVDSCTLTSGAEITVDLIAQFGETNESTFTPISGKVKFANWRFYYE